MLVIGPFIGVLKSAPAAHIVDEDRLEVGPTGLNLSHQRLQRFAAIKS